MGFIAKEILIGLAVSLIVTAFGFFLYVEYLSNDGFYTSVRLLKQRKILPMVIAIGALPNLAAFFIFLRKNQEYRSRGVLVVVILTALFNFALKFL